MREIPREVMDFVPEQDLELKWSIFTKCLKESPSGTAPGPGGCANEFLRVCLDDEESLQLLYLAAQDLASGRAPPEAYDLFMLATMTALSKKDGGVRGITTGTSFRRLVAKSLARQFGEEVERVCAPFQFALSTRAGTDCVGHAIRLAADLDPRATVLSIDGVGAYDHVLRSAMLGKIFEVESLRGLLPFVRATYAQPSCYHWQDEHGRVRQIRQHEGGEQGDPLMPLLLCLAVHKALMAVQEQLLPGEHIFAFLDDVYALSAPERTSAICKLLEETLFATAGIRLHTGKTRTWNRAGEIPEGMEELGDEVWNPTGIKILGTPVGSEEFHLACTRERLAEEAVLWRAIPWVQDLQCAWQLFVQCAGPRCNHFVRTVPPSFSASYAEGHDGGMQATMATLLEAIPGDASQQRVASQLATLPMRMGGLGSRSAARIALAAYWASWGERTSHDPAASPPDRPLFHSSGGERRSRWLCG